MDWSKFNKVSPILQSIKASPKLGLASVAASLVAPTLISNDDRGYFKSSLITTPVIAAAYLAGPKIGDLLNKEIPQYSNYIKTIPDSIAAAQVPLDSSGIKNLQTEFSAGRIRPKQFNEAVGQFYGIQSNVKGNFDQQVTQLRKGLETALSGGKEGTYLDNYKGVKRYLENVTHAEVLRSGNTSTILGYGTLDSKGRRVISPIAPNIGIQGVQNVIEEQIAAGNKQFVRGMNFHLKKMSNMDYDGTVTLASNKPLTKVIKQDWLNTFDANPTITLRDVLQQQRPDLFNEINNQIKFNRINPEGLNIVASNEPLNPILGLEYEGKRIPVVSEKGQIVSGKLWNKSGVSRMIATQDEVLKSDVFAIRYLHRKGVMQDLSRSNIIQGADTAEEWTTFSPGPGEGLSSGSGYADAQRAQEVILSDSVGWGEMGKQGFRGMPDEGIAGLSAYEQENVMGDLDSRGFTKTGSTSMANGVVQLKETEKAAFYGIANPADQESFRRGLAKPVTLSNLPDFNLTPEAKPYAISNYFTEMIPGEKVPAVGVTVGGVTAEQATFFGRLPSKVQDLHTYEQEAIDFLMKKQGVGETQARMAWERMSKQLSNPAQLQTMRKLGTLGEGSKIMERGLYGMNISVMRDFVLHEHTLGDNPERLIGTKISSDKVIGFNMGNPITPPTEGANYTFNTITDLGNGAVQVRLQEDIEAGSQGAKASFASVKRGDISATTDPGREIIKPYEAVYDENGLPVDKSSPNAKWSSIEGEAISLSGESEIERLIGGINTYNETVGDGIRLSKNNKILALAGSEIQKGDPINATFNLAAGTLRRMQEMGDTELVNKYTSALGQHGWKFGTEDATLLFNGLEQNTSNSRLSNIVKFNKAKEVVDQLMEDAGASIRRIANTNPYMLNETGRNFAATPAGTQLSEFLRTSENFDTMMMWDHSMINTPNQVKINSDTFQHLAISGQHDIIKAVRDRVQYQAGDPNMTREFAEYLAGDTSKITTKISAAEALGPNRDSLRLSSIKGRQGSVFDADHPIAKSNFLVEFENGETLPVLGHDAYGGRPNRYDLGKVSATSTEKSLFGKLKGSGDTEEYLKSLNSTVYGKNSFLKAEAIDPLGMGGYSLSRQSTLKFANGEVNPNQVRISEALARNIPDRELSEALLRGETGSALMIGYPIPSVPIVELSLDKTLQGNQIGTSNWRAAAIHRDFDHDQLFVHPIGLTSPKDRPLTNAEQSANSEIYDYESAQNSHLRSLAEQESDIWNELPENGGVKAKTLEEQLTKSLGNYEKTDEVRVKRMVSNTIGEYSNTESLMMTALEHNNTVTNLQERNTLRDLFFNIYQSPISAAKGKAESDITFEGARNLNVQLRRNMMPDRTFDQFHRSLMDVLRFTPQSVQETATNNVDLLRQFHSGINVDAVRAGKTRISSLIGDSAKADIEGSVIASRMSKYLPGAAIASQSESVGARIAAEATGAINESISTAAKVGKAFEGSGAAKALGIGLGAAALAGILTTSVSKKAKSMNAFRPEVASAGQDSIPGEGVVGSYASNPPRVRVDQRPANVNRAMVVPIQQSNDIDVTMKTDDPSRATEVAKMVARSSGAGQTIVTNNYKNNSLTSLRNKQKIRERLEE